MTPTPTIPGIWLQIPTARFQHYFKRDCHIAMCGAHRQGRAYVETPTAPCRRCADFLRREEERKVAKG
jgi:hypothetical protein